MPHQTTLGSLILILAALPLHRYAWRIPHLNPDRARTRPIGAIDLFGNDALGAKPTSVLEHCRAVPGDVFIEQDASIAIAQQPRQGSLAVEKRPLAQILAIEFDQVEGVEDRAMRSLTSAQILESR